MTRQEQAYNKIQQLNQEIAELQGYVRNIETEYEIITDQYMNCLLYTSPSPRD